MNNYRQYLLTTASFMLLLSTFSTSANAQDATSETAVAPAQMAEPQPVLAIEPASQAVTTSQKPQSTEVQAYNPTNGSMIPTAASTKVIDVMPLSIIDIQGNRRVEEATVLAFLGLKPGDEINADIADAGLNRLYESGLFADISMQLEGDRLNIRLIENPIVSQIAFEGNRRIDDEDIRPEISLRARDVYNKVAVQQDVKRILALYQSRGRYSAQVVPKLIQLNDNRVNIVYEVDEGEKSEISRVAFVGNTAFDDDRLEGIIATKEARWYRFLTSTDFYDADRIEYDKELLRRFYISEGYADFKVLAANAELTPDRKSFIVTFSIDEGVRYEYGDMAIDNRITDVTSDEMQDLLVTKPGRIFNNNEVEVSISNITDYLGNLGYAFVDVAPKINTHPETGVLDITYQIAEGRRVYVENINISGNVRTRDEVIRREFRLAEGDPFNSDRVQQSKKRIENLDFFSEVTLDKEMGSAPDKVNINVDVEEKSTGELTFGAGFSTTDGALGDIGLSERNLLGKGQHLRANFTLASSRQEFDIGFTEPYFMGRDVAAGFDLFHVKNDGGNSTTNRSYDNQSMGIVLRSSYSLTEYLRHTLRYSLRSDEITDIDPGASTYIQRQAGKYSSSMVGHSLTYDRRNSRIEPTNGYYLRLNQDVAGLGGDAQFFRNEFKAGYYRPLLEDNKLVLRLNGGLGHILGLGEDVRINDRFFIGSNDIRGFDSEGIGPRDQTTGDALGGQIYATGSVELGFPLGLPKELGVTGAVFSDFGTLFETDEQTNAGAIQDDASPRLSVGAGVGWNSPFGPIRIDLAHAVVKEEYDRDEIVRFSFGTSF